MIGVRCEPVEGIATPVDTAGRARCVVWVDNIPCCLSQDSHCKVPDVIAWPVAARIEPFGCCDCLGLIVTVKRGCVAHSPIRLFRLMGVYLSDTSRPIALTSTMSP